MKSLLNAVSDLNGKPFLHLKTAGVSFHHPCDFAQTCDFAIGDISHMTFAYERQHMMFASGVKVDVLHQHHLLVLFIENGLADDGLPILLITFSQILQGFCHSFGCFEQAFPIWVLS